MQLHALRMGIDLWPELSAGVTWAWDTQYVSHSNLTSAGVIVIPSGAASYESSKEGIMDVFDQEQTT